MKAPIQEVEGGLQDVLVSGAAFPTQFAHCRRQESPGTCHAALRGLNAQRTPALTLLTDNDPQLTNFRFQYWGTKHKLSVPSITANGKKRSDKRAGTFTASI